jgi:hypothetical protein
VVTFDGVFVPFDSKRSFIRALGNISIDAAARSIGRIARFCGHTHFPISVYTHSLACAKAVVDAPEGYFKDKTVATIHAMGHDTPESITNDVPSPFKSDHQREFEDLIWKAFCKSWRLPKICPSDKKKIKQIDKDMAVAEAKIYRLPKAETLGIMKSGLEIEKAAKWARKKVPFRKGFSSPTAWALFRNVLVTGSLEIFGK